MHSMETTKNMKKGPKHPKFADMICKAMLEEQNGNEYHGSTLQSLKKSIGHGGYEVSWRMYVRTFTAIGKILCFALRCHLS